MEVYFPTYGWVDFNPSDELTLVGTTIEDLIDGTTELELLDVEFELIPIENPLGDQGELLNQLLAPVELEREEGLPWTIIWSVGGVVAALAIVSLGGRVYWVWGLRGLSGMPRQWGSIERLAGWAGLRAEESETVRQWGERIGEMLERPEEATALSTAFEEARYGPPDLERTDAEETGDDYRVLRNALAARIFGRRSARRDEADEDSGAQADEGLDDEVDGEDEA